MTDLVLNIIQLILSVAVIVLVMVQAKSSGLSTVFGGGNFQTTRRGGEKVLHRATIITVAVLCIYSLVRVVYL